MCLSKHKVINSYKSNSFLWLNSMSALNIKATQSNGMLRMQAIFDSILGRPIESDSDTWNSYYVSMVYFVLNSRFQWHGVAQCTMSFIKRNLVSFLFPPPACSNLQSPTKPIPFVSSFKESPLALLGCMSWHWRLYASFCVIFHSEAIYEIQPPPHSTGILCDTQNCVYHLHSIIFILAHRTTSASAPVCSEIFSENMSQLDCVELFLFYHGYRVNWFDWEACLLVLLDWILWVSSISLVVYQGKGQMPLRI